MVNRDRERRSREEEELLRRCVCGELVEERQVGRHAEKVFSRTGSKVVSELVGTLRHEFDSEPESAVSSCKRFLVPAVG